MVNHGLFLRESLETVGWADEDRYIFYKADGDLCLKMWEAGYEVVDCPGAFVEHLRGRKSRRSHSTNREVLVRDRAAYRERWDGIFWDPDGPELRASGSNSPTTTHTRRHVASRATDRDRSRHCRGARERRDSVSAPA